MMSHSKIKPFHLVFNTEGIREDHSVFFSSSRSAEKIVNLHSDLVGTYTAYKQGYSVLTSSPLSSSKVNGLDYFKPIGATLGQIITASGGSLYSINAETGVTLSTIYTGLSPLEQLDSEVFRGNLYITQKGYSTLKYSGSGSAVIASGFPITLFSEVYSAPALVEKHVNRLVYANFNGATAYPSHIAISDDLSPETFTLGLSDTDGAIIQVSPGDGQSITALKSIHLPSSNETVLIIFKESSVFALNGDTPSSFSITLINDSVGAINNRCVAQVGNDVLFLDKFRITSLSAVNNSGTIQIKSIESDNVRKTLKEFNLNAKDEAFAIHLPAREEVWFAIPTGSSSVVNKILVYKYQNGSIENGIWSVKSQLRLSNAILTDKQELITGSYSGELFKFFNSSLYGGEPFKWQYRYGFYNFDEPLAYKRILDCNAWFLSPTVQDVTLSYEWRGGKGSCQKTLIKPIITSQVGALYSAAPPVAAIYGQDFYSEAGISKVKLPIVGNGEQIRFDVSGETSELGSPVFIGITGLVEIMDYSRSV